ncbi:hypothetical protein ACGFZQ_20615 [Streptomyces sp. NPDC048254]|uniref:hypothetical protein n=1 Tax=Streptomyces sp. NPDC048254 TaxID=3365525 RepID=UPI003710D9A1
MRSAPAALAGSGVTEAVSAARDAGLAADAAAGVERSAKAAAAVADEFAKVKLVAEAHGHSKLPELGNGVLWANKAENYALMAASHIAKLKQAGWTKDQIQVVYDAYKKVGESTPKNPSADP